MKLARLFPSALLLIGLAAVIGAAQTTAPTTAVGSTSAVQTVTLTFAINSTVSSINVLTQGAPNLDFQFAAGGTCIAAKFYLAGQTCTVNYTFKPAHPGLRSGAVVLYNTASPTNAAATTYLHGTGQGPQVVFSPFTTTVLSFASVRYQGSIAFDGNDNFFYTDLFDNKIREVLAAGGYTTTRILTTLYPAGIALDGAGNLFLANGSNLKELVAASGYSRLVTVASGFFGLSGIAVDGSGNVFAADSESTSGSPIYEFLASGGYETRVTIPTSASPRALAIDGSGNLFAYMVNYDVSTIVELTASSGYQSSKTIAKLQSEANLALDSQGNLFVFKSDGYAASSVTEFFAVGGYTSSRVIDKETNWAKGIAFDSNGSLFIFPNYLVKMDFTEPQALSFQSTAEGTISGDSPQAIAIANNGNQPLSISSINYPPDFAEPVGLESECPSPSQLNAGESCTLHIDFAPQISGDPSSSPLSESVSIIDNNLNVANAVQNTAVYGVGSSADTSAQTDPPTPVGAASASQTATLTFTASAVLGSINTLTQGAPNQDFLYASGGTCTIGTAYTAGQTCTVSYTFRPTHAGARYGAVALYDNSSPANPIATTYLRGMGFGAQTIFKPGVQSILPIGSNSPNPIGLAVDGKGNLFTLDSATNALKEIMIGGGYKTVNTLAGGFSSPRALALDGAGNVFVADYGHHLVKEVLAAGGYTKVVTVGSGITKPISLAVDGTGNVFVSDDGTVKEILAAGGYTTVNTLTGVGGGGLATDFAGNLFLLDSGVKEVLAANGYTVINPLGKFGAAVHNPVALALDGSGNVFVADAGRSPNSIEEFTAATDYADSVNVIQAVSSPAWLALGGAGNLFYIFTNPNPGPVNAIGKLDLGDPPILTFATTPARAKSVDSPKTVALVNNGNQTLHINALKYPADFPKQTGVTSNCPGSIDLAAGSNCTLTINFAPLVASLTGDSTPLNEKISWTDNYLNALNKAESISVTGTENFAPELTTPQPTSLISPDYPVTFTWLPGAATNFQFRLGTQLGSNDIYGSGPTTATSESVSNLPTNGTIHARLYYQDGSTLKSLDYVYYLPTYLTSPPPGQLRGSVVTFTWNPGSATNFEFTLGTTSGSNNLYDSGQTSASSITATNLPTNGETIHARLSYVLYGAWQHIDYVFTAQ